MRCLRQLQTSAVRRRVLAGAVATLGVGAGVAAPVSGAIVVVGALVLLAALVLLNQLNRRDDHLDAVHAFTRDLGEALDDGDALDTVLRTVVTSLHVEEASVLLLDDGAGEGYRLRYRGSTGTARTPIDVTHVHTILDRLPSDRWGGVHATPDSAHELCELVGAEDALVHRLGSRVAPIGLLVAATRRGGADRFDQGDLELLRVMAAHAGAAIDNGVLVTRLRIEVSDRVHNATHDLLTGLLNREGLLQSIDRDLTAVATGHSVGLLVVDLTRFKEINEGLGLPLADRYLIEVAQRITSVVPPHASVARVGADEFAIAVTSERVRGELSVIVRAIVAAFEPPVLLDELTVDIAGVFGAAIGPDHADTAALLLQRAGMAQQRAVETHKPLVTFTRREADEAPQRLAMVGELRRGIAAGEVVPYYQPKIDVATGRTVGCEALARWFHPERGMISPADFIPLAEQTGLMGPLTESILLSAITQTAQWNARGHDVSVAVNLSARNLAGGDLARNVAVAVHAAGLRPDRLTLEVTESTVMDTTGRSDLTLKRLDELGVQLSIDDFGTGYSSLSYLRSLPLDELKIDRAFVMRLPSEPEDQVIVRSTIDLAHGLGLEVVAEGVEDEETLVLLSEMAADRVQGYHTGRPMPAADLTARLEAETQATAEARRRTFGVA